jgi:adenylate cyclase
LTTSSNRTLWATIALVVASFLFVHFLLWVFSSITDSWNAQVFDQLFRFRSSSDLFRNRYDSIVVHVDLSDASLRKLGSYYVDRAHFARVMRNLGEMRTAVQVWDFIIADRTSPEADKTLVEGARAAGNVYFGLKFDLKQEEDPPSRARVNPEYTDYLRETSWKIQVEGDATKLYRGENPIASFAEFALALKGMGYLSVRFDYDGVFRRQPLIVRYEDGFYPSFPFRAICDYLQVSPDRIVVRPGSSITLQQARFPGGRVRDVSIPVDDHASIIVNYVGPWERMKHYDFADVYAVSDDRDEMELLSEELDGRLVVVSQVTTGSSDVGPVPTDNNFPLSGVHANIMHTILTEDFLVEVKGIKTLLIEIFLLAIIVLFSVRRSSTALSFSALALVILYVLSAAAAFLFANMIFEIFRPSLTIIVTFFSLVAYRYINEEKQKEALRKSFEAYFPPSVVQRIMANPDLITAGGQKKELTILFSDIKSFTTYSSTLTPDEIQKLLNEYFGAMVDIVFKYEGTVDKFIGDGLMVFFGDPEPQDDHALRCVKAAIEMQKKCRELKTRWEREGKFPLRVRIGINTGPVVVGNMGSSRRLSYTVLGSAVNLAQRLESNAPVEGIMISQRTYELVKGLVPTRPLEPIKVKGLEEPIPVYEVIVDETGA